MGKRMQLGKSIFILVLFLAIGCTSELQKAQKAQQQGDCSTARSHFVAALSRVAAVRRMPDLVKAQQVSPEAWRNEVGEFLSSLSTARSDRPADIGTVIQGLISCSLAIGNENILVGIRQSQATPDSLWARWRGAFFPPTMTPHQSHRPLVERAVDQNLSMVVLRAVGKNYSYEGFLLERASGCLVPVTLYQESSTSLVASAGNHLLIIRSTVTFPTKEVWRSSFSVLPLEIPRHSSIITADVVTKVSRR